MSDGAPFNPFPGLRPFRTAERYLFFGREGQSEAILGYLREHHFVALVGSSGSGKSSLINAGLLPYLYGGFLAEAGSSWRVAICRPGTDPIGNLASVLCNPEVLGGGNSNEARKADEVVLMEVTLRGSSVGLIDAVQLARLPSNTRLVIVIDQFEELFRFAGVGSSQQGEDAAAFVNLLLEAQSRPNLPIYLVLAMRSDYIGDCARFRGLPEAIMSAIYLIPRMTRDQRRQAIEGPVRVGEGEIALRLINRLLNDVGDKSDQLPSMQHALMRTWEYWQAHRTDESPIDLDDYNAVGGLAKALSNHADEAFDRLPDDESRRIARLAFQCLTGKDINSREARHPVTVQTIAAVAKADPEAVIKVINHFREPERAFLTPVWGIDITGRSIIDVSHESLIRGWDSLRNWVLEEAESAKIYLRLAEGAALHMEGNAGLWRDPELQLALDWYNKTNPTDAWASRYDPGFKRAVAFLDASREERDAGLRARKLTTQVTFVGVAVVACIITGLALFVWQTIQGADAARSEKQKTRDAYLAQVAAEWTRTGDAGAALPLALEIFLDNAKESRNIYFPQGELALESALRHLHERFVLAASTDRPHQRPDPVSSAAFSKDSKYIVTASMDGKARLWDAATGQPLGIEMPTDGSSINDVSFSPAGDRIVTVTDDGTTSFWNASNGQKIETPLSPEHGSVSSSSYSVDGRHVITSHEDGAACVWDTSSYTSACTFVAVAGLRSAAFSPDGSKFAAGSSDGVISIWRTDTLTPIETAAAMRHGREVTGIGYTPDGKSIVTTSSDGTWAVWNSETGANLRSINATSRLNGLAISSDGTRLVTASADNTAQIWDIASGKVVGDSFVSEIGPSDYEMRRVAFSPDMKRVLTASGDGTARLWDIEIEINVPVLLQGHKASVRSANFSSDGSRVATSSYDHTARIWDAVTGDTLKEFRFGEVAALDATFSPDGKFIVVALADGSAPILSVTDQQRVDTVKMAEKGPMNTAVFSRDGKRVAVAYDSGSVWVWDLQNRTAVGPLGADARGARSAVFSRDGLRLLTAHRDGTARIWDSRGGALIAQTPPASSKALRRANYNSDETLIITASGDGTARIWDARNQALVASFSEGSKILYSAFFSPDGRRLLTASQDQAVRLSDTGTGEPITEPFGNKVLSAAFSPDGKRVVIASADGIARVWSVFENTDELVNHAKAVAPRCLSTEERNAVTLLPPQQDRWCDDTRKWWSDDRTNE